MVVQFCVWANFISFVDGIEFLISFSSNPFSIKDSLFIPVDDILSRIDELPEDKKLIFICAAGVRSGLACEMAASMGINPENLYNIEEGTPTWIENGYPTDYLSLIHI